MYIVHWTKSQGSVLESILMTIFLSDLLLVINEHDLSSYVDDNIIHDYANSINDIFIVRKIVRKIISMVLQR